MRAILNLLFALGVGYSISISHAHHSVPAEYGSDAPLREVAGEVSAIRWVNPHVSIAIVSTGGDLPPGEQWHLMAHPIHIMEETYGIRGSDFDVGDQIRVLGKFHLRGFPQMQIRAISVNGGPMRSVLEHTDLQDLASGDLQRLGITPTHSLDGAKVNRRINADTLNKLKEMGFVTEDNLVDLSSLSEETGL